MTRTIRRTWRVDGVLTDVTSAVLSDPAGAYGVKRDDTSAAVVADGTAMTHVSAGVYEYTFTEPAAGLAYTAYVEIVYDGQTYWLEHDLPAETTTTGLAVSYDTLRVAIADFLGIGRDAAAWGTDDIARLDAVIRSALNQVYFPRQTAQNGVVHLWSFLRPLAQLTTSAPYTTGTVTVTAGVVTLLGDSFPTWAAQGELDLAGQTYGVASRDSATQLTLSDTDVEAAAGTAYTLRRVLYDLPEGYAGMDGGTMTYLTGQWASPAEVSLVSDLMVRRARQQRASAGRPECVAVRPAPFDAAVGQRYHAVFYPTPDSAYVLEYRYQVIPAMLSATNPWPLGGPEIGELILEACLAVAEQRYGDTPGLHTEQFPLLLAAAVASDAQRHSPDTLGASGESSDMPAGFLRPPGVAIHSYNGITPYDRNL